MTVNTSDNRWANSNFIVAKTIAEGAGYTTIGAAITAAGAGPATIFIKQGTYTENITLPASINLSAFGADSSQNGTGTVIISGTITKTSAGTSTISGIQLQTNSAALLAVTGTLASVVNLENCYLNMTNATGITFSSSSASAAINIRNCQGNLGTTGIGVFAHSSDGTMRFFDTDFFNTGGSSTANTVSAGVLNLFRTNFTNPLTTSGTATFTASYSAIDSLNQNVTALTCGGSGGNNAVSCYIISGTASAISISSTLNIYNSIVTSSNTNAITGAGTIHYIGLILAGTSKTINTTTQSTAGTIAGSTTTAPTAGMLGEQIRATVASGSAVTLTASGTPTNITSISLTAGIWDVSCICVFTNSVTYTATNTSISTVSATVGTNGDNMVPSNGGSTAVDNISQTIPSYRLTLTTTTTVYLVATGAYGAGTGKAFGRISATRVG